MNYTNPNDLNHEDKPEDWLNSALIFARALSIMLDENQGIVVKLTGDIKFYDGKMDKVIVFYKDGMVRIIECDEDLDEGTVVMISDINPN